MSIHVSPEVNAMIFILTGEKLMDADEDLAFESRLPYSGLGRKLNRLSSLIDKSIHDIGEAMPDDLSKSYAQAMGMLIDDGGKNYLKEFAGQLDQIAEGRRKTSMDIMESKWQVIAEIIRLLIEIALYLAMSFFTGGASASQIMMAKLRSRFFILTTLSHLLQRLHLAPSLTEAFAEAFTTFAVRLAMMNFAPNGRRPDGFDWNDILKSAAFGAAAGFFTSVFDRFAKNIVNGYGNNFLKNGPDLNFKKGPDLHNTPGPDLKNNGPSPKPDPVPSPKPDGLPHDRPNPKPYGNGPDPYGTGPKPSTSPGVTPKPPVTFRNDPLSFQNNLNLWRNNTILRDNADRPGALTGYYTLKLTTDFLASGSGEAAGEILIKGAFDGDWSTSWTTFVGAGISNQVEGTLTGAAVNSGAELRHVIDKMGNPPTVSGGISDSGGSPRSADANGSDSTDGPSRRDTTGGGGPATGSSSPTGGQGGFTSEVPPPYVAESSPYTGQAPPLYTTVDPPVYSPGSLSVTAAENELWQQVHTGSAEVREQALNDFATLRGAQPPGSTEIGVRDSLRGDLSQLPEVRVVPAGGSPAAQIDVDEVRRALDGFGTPVTVDPPPAVFPGPGAGTPAPAPADAAGGPAREDSPGPAPAPEATPESTAVDVPEGLGGALPGDSGVVSPEGLGGTSPQGSPVVAPENPEGNVQSPPHAPAESAGQDGAAAAPVQGGGSPVPTGGPTTAAPGAGSAGRPGGVPPAGGAQAPSATPPQGTRTPDGTVPGDGSQTVTDESAQTAPSPEAIGPTGAEATPDSGDGITAPDGGVTTAPDGGVTTAPDGAVTTAPDTVTTTGADTVTTTGTDTVTAPDTDSATTPPKVSTVGSFTDTGDTGNTGNTGRTGNTGSTGDMRGPGGTADVKSGAISTGNPESTQAPPLTIVVSEVPPPGQGSPEAAALLDGAGTDRAVVLGPPVAPDGVGRPGRAAVELTREGPGAPVRVRPLAGPTADGTTTDTAFPGADVLLPLADALGPVPRPATQSGVSTEGVPSVTSPTNGPTGRPDMPGPVPGDIAAPAKLATLSRPWTETATDLHLEKGETNGPGTGGQGPGTGGGRGPGSGGTPPPPLTITQDNPSATPPPALPPGGHIVVRPADSGPVPGNGNGPARSSGQPTVTTLDGRTVPVAQLRRWMPDAAVKPLPGRAVQTLTVSQSRSEDGTARAEGRRGLLGEDTFRGVRTTSEAPAQGTSSVPPVPRTVFTGSPAPLPGSGTELGADYFAGHGTSRTVTLGTEDAGLPTVEVSGVQLGEVLNSWAQDGHQDRPLVLFSCETGQQPKVAGLPVAQHVANRTGRPVYAPTTEVGTAKDGEGNVRAVLADGPDGPGRWRLFTPEPSGAALDGLARDAGLHAGPGPADAFALTRTLQQVRTLRDVLGPDAEQRPENRELLGGLAFVDGLRWHSPDAAARYGDGRMTPDLLRRMVMDHRGATTGDPAAEPTAEQYGDFLRDAAGLRATAGPATTLDALLPPPPPTLPPTALVSQEDVRGLSYAPAARVTWSLSSAPLPVSELALSPEDAAELARRRPDLAPPPSRSESLAQDLTVFSKAATTPGPVDTVHADGLAFRRLDTPGGGDCLFRSLLDSARSRDLPPAWAARNVAGLRGLLRDRITGSELGDTVALAIPDPVFAVVDDLRMRAVAGVRDPAELNRITQLWNRIARDVVSDGDTGEWQRILRESDYPHLAEVAPTPADARRLGTAELVASAAERPALWASPFADLLPEALAHTLDLDLRLVQPGNTRVTTLNPGGRSGALHLAYNGTDHYDALVPASAPLTPDPTPTTTQDPATTTQDPAVEDPATQDPYGPDPFGEWLRGMGGITDLDTPDSEVPDRGDPVPLETQLDRHRPARLLTGPDARPPGPVPHTVTFDDGSRLPTVLISPDADPDDGTPGTRTDGTARSGPTGLFTGLGKTTLRSPEQVAEQILGGLPAKLRSQFDEADLLRLLTEQPGAFTAPRGARFVGREKSGVGHEMTVEAIPYHRWERFSDVDGGTVRLDTMRRGQAGTGGGRSVGFGRRIAGGLSMGPPLNWLLKIGFSLSWTRRTDYTQGTQAYNQSEWRNWEGSHLHLDDVHYRVRVERVTEAPPATAPGTPSGTATGRPAPAPSKPSWQRSQVHSADFAMRDGLSWRLPDDLTVPYKGPQRAPKTLTFPDGVEPRITDTTGLHLTDPPEDTALAISGARPGSSAHRTLVSYVRPGRLLPLFGRLSGPVTGPELTRGSGQHPLGHLIVERSVPTRATLVTESVKTELRDLTQTTYQNQRGHLRDTRLGFQVTAGPNYTLAGLETDVRLQGGPLVRADISTGRGHYVGADAARKTTGRVRNHPVALYRVERTLMVRKPGELPSAARPVRVVSLDWMSTQDARRLAGWDSRTPGSTGPDPDAEPPVPWYLTREDPVHLSGQVRAEGFVPSRPQPQVQPPLPPGETQGQDQTQDQSQPPPGETQDQTQVQPQPQVQPPAPAPQDPMRAFADTVLDTLHHSYPSLFVPPFMLRHPRLAKFWYGDGRMRTALHNDRQVREALNRPSLAQSLDDLTTTGVPVTLTEDGKVRRGHHTLILRARLTDRRFETTMSERSLRNAVIGTEVSGQGQQASVTLSGGIELGISPRDHDKVPGVGLPQQAGSVSVGARHARTDRTATRSTVAVTHDNLTFQTGADLYSYQVELGATFEGHRRPRGWVRLASAGVLGSGIFVSKVEERPLFTQGNETVGRVELAVPAAHGSEHHAPADPQPAAPAPAPPQRLSSTEADQLLDGIRPLPRTDSADQLLTTKLLSSPHVVLSAEGGPQRQQLMQDTADHASGTSWHVSAPGAPVRTALRRAMANLSVAGQLGQYLGPFGSRISGLNGAGPFRTHYLKAAVRGQLSNFRVMSAPKPASLEATVGNEHRVNGSASTVSRTTLGLQGGDTPVQQAPGQTAVVGSYTTAMQYAWGKGRGLSQTLAQGRNTTLTFAGRMYLVVADTAETVAVRDRWTAAMGAVGTRAGARISALAGRLSEGLGNSLAPRRAAAALQRIRDAVMFHLPMQDVIEAGLAPDGMGTTTPRNLGGGYRVPPYLRDRHFPTHPSGRLDAGPAARQLMGQLEKAGVPSHDREQVLQRLSPDFLAAHLHELTTDGMALPVRYRAWSSPLHLPVGGSPGQVVFKLTPVTTTVERLRTGYELEDYRNTARDTADGTSQDRGADVTLSGGQRAADSGLLVANPSLQGVAAKQRSSTRTQTAGTTAMPNITTTQAHAEIVTSYTLTVTMTAATGDLLAPRAVGVPVGSLNEILPASLLTPDGPGADGALTEQDVPAPERAVRLLTPGQARPDGVAAWRTSAAGDPTAAPDPDVLPFDDRIGSGILAVDIRGAANVQDALTLATARADGLGDGDLGKRLTGEVLDGRVRTARLTPLTGLGTAPAQAQQEATTQVGLTSGFREALGADGVRLPTQASAHLFGQSHTADSRLYAKMHRSGARLLAVENKPRLEAMQRAKTSDALEAGITDNVEGAVGTAPLAGNSNAGVTNPGATLPVGGTNDGATLKSTVDTTLGTHTKVVTDRSMLFAVPVSWLSVSEVDHRFTDSRPLYALGKAERGPRAAEAETTALVWLREDIARDYGLLDESTLTAEVLAAWDGQAKAAGDLATAEKGYYDARARARETWLGLSADEQTALGADEAHRPATLPESLTQSPAVAAWQAARDEVNRWQQRTDTAAADHHRLHLAASRLTAHHQGSVSVPVKDLPQEYTEPKWRSEAPEPYVVTDATGSTPRTLTSPDGTTVREVHEVPHDGASFFHALLAAAQDRGRLAHLLGSDLADRFAADPGGPEVTAEAIGAARDRLAWALGQDGNEDLLDALALDAADTFTQDEIDSAGVVLTPPQKAEFDAFGRLPQTVWPTPGQRVALATTALSRPFASEPTQDGANASDGRTPPPERLAGDHGGADLLPALAARVLGTPLTVVTGEGRDQLFLPHGTDPATVDPAADPVLFATGGFFHAALPPGSPAPVTASLPAPAATGTTDTDSTQPAKPPAHRTHARAPWLPPADISGPRYRLARDGVLTAPDGATYTQGAPSGRGNGFFGALSTALHQAAEQPGAERHEAGRLRSRAGAPPAQLMRLNGLPGTPAERDSLFTPPPLQVRPGAPAPSPDAVEGHLRRHLAEAPWGPGADQAVAEWAAAATGTTVTLIEENGTAHTYPGASADSPVLRLRRRGGDFVPLLPRTPAPEPAALETPKAPGTTETAETSGTRETQATPPVGTTPPAPEHAPPAPPMSEQDPAAVPLPPSPGPTDGSDNPGLPGLLGEEEAYELSTLSGARDEALAQFRFTDTPEPDADALARFRFTDDTSDSDSEDDATAHERWPGLLFGPAARNDHSPEMLVGTALSLRELAQAHAESSSENTSAVEALHGLTRRLLNLGPADAVDERHILLLGSLALSASPRDLADEASLTSYLTRHDAALHPATRLVSEEGAWRNWTVLDELDAKSGTGTREDGGVTRAALPHRPARTRPASGANPPMPQSANPVRDPAVRRNPDATPRTVPSGEQAHRPAGPAPPATAGPSELAAAWDTHARGLAALAEAAAEAATLERVSGDGTAVAEAWAGVDEARRRLEDTEARLLTLGVTPDALGAARDAGGMAAPGDRPGAREGAPVVPRDDGGRRWIAGQLTEGDLPAAPLAHDAGGTVGLDELGAVGITPSQGQRTEMMVRGDGRLPVDELSPLDLVRVRMARPDAWTAAMDTAAANASRRLWAGAYADFAGTAPEGTAEADATRAWAAAVSLVLPAEPHAVLADSRYAGDDFRDAVRRVAGHLLGNGAGTVPESAAELADSLRSGLGLRQRWAAPVPEATARDRTLPSAQSGTGADMPGFDPPAMDDMDLSVLDDFDPSVLDGMDLGTFDFDMSGLGFPDPPGPDLPDLDMTDLDMTDLDMTDLDMTDPAPIAPDLTALTTGSEQPVFVAPAAASSAGPLAALPRLSLVTFGSERTSPSADAAESLERLAFQVAKAGLRNRRTRVPLPKTDIAGYGADARRGGTAQERAEAVREVGELRARAAHELFVQKLDHALRVLQENPPAGHTRLTAQDFRITSRGRTNVPGQGATVGASEQVSRADLGRQATIAVTSPGHAAAVEALDALRRKDRALRTGGFDVDAVARRILHLEPFVLVDPEMRRDFYRMVERAIAAGRASGAATLTAFHLEEQGVLAPDRAQHVSLSGTRLPGLTWTGPDVAELSSLFVEDLRPDQAGGFVPTGTLDLSPWPWEVTPYLVLAEGRHDTVTARLPDGTTQDLDADDFAELVAADLAREGLPVTTPVVLAVPFAGDRYLELPRKLAERTGHTVWVHSGLARRHPDPAGQSTVAVIRRDGLPHGSWVPVRPGLAPDPEDGAPDWHRDVVTQAIVSTLTGQQIGRSLHEPGELASSREDNFSHLDRMTVYVHYNPATGTYSPRLPLEDPGPKEKAYHLAGHGMPGRLTLPMADGTSRTAGRREAGEWLRRRKSLSSLPQDHWIDLVVCSASTLRDRATEDLSQLGASFAVPFAADPLADDAVSLGQHLANVTGRTVRLSYSLQGPHRLDDEYVRVLFNDARGHRTWWETSRPEPRDAELDRLALAAGFEGDPSPGSRAETLRLVRALRMLFGHDVEDVDDFATLIRGAGAVDNMWHVDPDLGRTGPFSTELLRRVVAAHPEAASGVSRRVTRDVLAAAALAWQSGPALPVSGFVDLPVLHAAAGWLQDTAAVDKAAVAALELSDAGEVGAAERARMFWARVRAEETMHAAGADADALTARALHLDPAVEVNDALRDDALTRLTQGFAVGRDMADPDVAGAYDLRERGAFDEPMLPSGTGSASSGGRDWKDETVLLPDLGRFRAPDGTFDAPWAGKDASGKDKPVPYLVRASVDFEDSDHLDVNIDGTSYRVPAAEFAELLASDAPLRELALTTPVLLVLEGLGGPAPGVADVIAQRLGRSVWWSPFPVEISAPDGAGSSMPTLTDSLATMTSPTAADWREARPVDPAGAP
ncbi:lonely Cys domain-containing protein [Streptomyces sp. NPDC058439]|uniref:lonely Cys domain-containing protein n=1 Tax=Streptomyces sp. NPDC058439 TaxID=3346500 RepID=UPI0036667859